jgi:hypothetical protein
MIKNIFLFLTFVVFSPKIHGATTCSNLFLTTPQTLLEKSVSVYQEKILKKEEGIQNLIRDYVKSGLWIDSEIILKIIKLNSDYRKGILPRQIAISEITKIIESSEVVAFSFSFNKAKAVETILDSDYKVESVLLAITHPYHIRQFAESFGGKYLEKSQPNSKFFIERDLGSFAGYFEKLAALSQPRMRAYKVVSTRTELLELLKVRKARLVQNVEKLFAPLTIQDVRGAFLLIEKLPTKDLLVDATLSKLVEKIRKSPVAIDFLGSLDFPEQAKRRVWDAISTLIVNTRTDYEVARSTAAMVNTNKSSVLYIYKEIRTINRYESDLHILP